MGSPDTQISPQEGKTDPKAFLSIMRPQNCIIGGLTVIAGIAIAAKVDVGLADASALIMQFIYAFITYFFVAAGSNVVNDIFDIEIDKINRPHRALPSGRLSIKQAWIFVGILSILGVIFAFLNGLIGTVVVIVFLVIGYAYAAKVKQLGIAGNFMVAFSFAFGIIYGTLVYGESVENIVFPIPTWLFFITAFMILQARETIKGAEDVEGDALRDVRTIARVYGYKAAAGVAALFNFIGVTCYLLIWYLGFASLVLWPFLILGAGVVAGAGIVPLTGPNKEKQLLIGSTLDKVGALVGLLAFVFIPFF
ncbi:MAG: geranylgeranylglycerol-phosphate geranylgeranyltransferase [Candidatus Thorarchaeota archaeon]|nr:geranylgeranylglycerol-phosphate geranylgeranyltransferase [Candidatus Thorarchaeota archaeon]